MARRANHLSLLTGFVLSLAVHLLVIAPVLTMALTRVPRGQSLLARFDPEAFRQPPEEEEPVEEEELQLGIDESVASTLTWIGYEEYEEHLARLAEFEQAAFTDEPAGPPTPPPTLPVASVAPSPPPQPPEATPPEVMDTQPEAALEIPTEAEDEPAATELAETAEPLDDAPESAALEAPPAEPVPVQPFDEQLMPLTGPDEAAGLDEEPEETEYVPEESPEADEPEPPAAPRALPWPIALMETLRKATERMESPTMSPKPPQESPPTPPAQPTAPVPAAEPQPPQPPAPGGADQGDQSDRESDATSVVKVPLDQIEAGKPVAAKGLELKTRKPEFTHLILLTAAPGNPLVEIRFASDGIPQVARIIQSSGDPRVDEFLLSSLYRWRATGKPLAEIKGEQTIDVEIRIVLNPRAPH